MLLVAIGATDITTSTLGAFTVAIDKTSKLGGNLTVKGEIDTINASALELGKANATLLLLVLLILQLVH